jgi:hypothetical protein
MTSHSILNRLQAATPRAAHRGSGLARLFNKITALPGDARIANPERIGGGRAVLIAQNAWEYYWVRPSGQAIRQPSDGLTQPSTPCSRAT